MRAIRVYLDTTDTDLIGGVVERLNDFDDIAATMVDSQELFIAAAGQCAINHAESVIRTSFNDKLTIQKVK